MILKGWKRAVTLLCSFTLVVTLTTMWSVAAEKTEIKFTLVCGTQEIPAWQSMVDAFNEQSPTIKVVFERLPGGWNEFNQKMMVRVAAGNPSDIGRMSPISIAGFEKVGAVLDLMPFIEEEGFDLTEYWESAINAWKKEGHMYAFPGGIYTQAVFYNKGMFDEAGVPYPPTDWKDDTWDLSKMIEHAKKLTKGEGPTKQFGMYVEIIPDRASWYLWNNGADFVNEEKTKSTVTEPGAIAAFQLMQDLIWKYKVATTPVNYKVLGMRDLFTTGRMGMIQSGQWMLPGLAGIKDLKWGVAPYPAGKAGRSTIIWADSYTIFEGSKHPKEAWEVVKFFVGEGGGNVLADYGLMGTPVKKSVAEAWRTQLYEPLPLEEGQVWWDSLMYARQVRIPSVWDEYRARIMEHLELLVLNNISAEEAAQRISRDVDPLLKRAQ